VRDEEMKDEEEEEKQKNLNQDLLIMVKSA